MLQTRTLGDWFEIIIPNEWDGLTLEQLFRDKWDAPKKLTHHYRTEPKATINGRKANWLQPFQKGDRLAIQLFLEEENHILPWAHEIPILYEDDHLIVFNKPPFMNTHPNDMEHDRHTLLNAAAYHMNINGQKGAIRQIHRLDQDTSGAILFAKHALAGGILDRMLEQHRIKRTYLALVHGLLKRKKGTIQKSIGRDRHHAVKRRVSPTGQPAITHYQVLKLDKEKQLTLLKVWLETGRTHQIRVHLSDMGHPLAGDLLYGGKPIFKRQALHSAKLEFIHPLTMEKIEVFAPVTDVPEIFTTTDLSAL